MTSLDKKPAAKPSTSRPAGGTNDSDSAPQEYYTGGEKRFSDSTSTMALARELAMDRELIEDVDSMNHSSTSHTISPHDKDYKWKWRLVTEVKKVFSEALTVAFEDFPAKCLMLCCKRDDGEFECDNVLNIWPKIRNSNIYPDIQVPKDVGERIKDSLVKLKHPMIEGEPHVHDGGFVTIKLSGNWMIESIHKMLIDGIDTWAPRQDLEFKSTIINSPSWDESNLSPMDVIRRQLIIMSRMHMLEYVKSVATTSSGNWMSLPSDMDDHFKTVERDGEVLIFPKDEANTEPLVHGKSRISRGKKKDGSRGYPLEDLGSLWHGLVNEESDWIVCVAPSQQQDYIEECFDAAEHAGWTTDTFWPLATYVGFKTCSTPVESLSELLSSFAFSGAVLEAAEVLGYTCEAVLNCALTYTFLKSHRLVDCKFSYNDMLDIQGDTFIHLLTTQAHICQITTRYRKEIDEAKKAIKQVLEANNVLCCEGVERELGLYLLMFTELVNESYLSFLPHVLCRYIYNLSDKFSRFYETYSSSGFKENTTLLLCEATAVVMEKGFQLLGISQETTSASLRVAPLGMWLSCFPPSVFSKPLKSPNIRTRFEIFTTYLHIARDHDFTDGKLFGCFQLSDHYGLLAEEWGEMANPGPGLVNLFSYNWSRPEEVSNNGLVDLVIPNCRHSIPFSSSMEMCILLYATTDNKDGIYEVCNDQSHMYFSDFLKSGEDSKCEFLVAEGDDGIMRMHFILLRDAIDARIEVKFCRRSERTVHLVLLGHYGDDFDYGDDDVVVKSFYKASLYSSVLKAEDVDLTRSVLAVPKDGSLVIQARFTDSVSGDVIHDGELKFNVNSKGSIDGNLECRDCTLNVKITWSNGEEEDF